MIYLDHAAATPVSQKALQSMLPYFSDDFFNPSAPYLPAKRVREAYESAKDTIAHAIGAKGNDIVITAGATESINLAFTACPDSCKILIPATEHAAVLEAAKSHQPVQLQVDQYGLLDLANLRAKLTDDVALISISLANNELGTIQPLAEISTILREVRQDRLKRDIKTPLYFHTDASQAANLIDINVARLGVDLLTLNAAKCGGPKGIGALYINHGVNVRPLSRGGGQERGLRSGTENVPGVMGFAQAITDAKSHLSANRKQYQQMASILRRELARIPDISEPIFLGSPKHQLANFIPVSFPGLDAERLIYKLEAEQIYVSTGAACAANKGTKSHVLTAIGLSDEEIAGSLRISLGSTNDITQIHKAAQIITKIIRHEYLRLYERRRSDTLLSQNSPRPTGSGRSEQAACNDRPARTGSGKKMELNAAFDEKGIHA